MGYSGFTAMLEASNLTYLGLYALQHRGQESAGIASADGTQIRVSKAMGYVNEAFDVDTADCRDRSPSDMSATRLPGKAGSPTHSRSWSTACTASWPLRTTAIW